jgi:hypothetical protein
VDAPRCGCWLNLLAVPPGSTWEDPPPGRRTPYCYACWQQGVAGRPETVPPPAPPPPAIPCRFQDDDPVPAARASAAGKNPLKLWARVRTPGPPARRAGVRVRRVRASVPRVPGPGRLTVRKFRTRNYPDG